MKAFAISFVITACILACILAAIAIYLHDMPTFASLGGS
jgi:hypothetical protein